MLKFYKLLSVLLHPVFIPIVATGIYLSVLPLPIVQTQKYLLFFLVTGATLLLPLLTLFLLKLTGYVKTNEATTIAERKLPVIVMVVNYLFLAITLQKVWQVRELTILAYATAINLLVTYVFFYAKIKISLHMLGMAGLLGFTLVYGINYGYSIPIIALLIILTGVLATARLFLKAHTLREVVAGTLLGVAIPMVLHLFL